MAARSLNQVFLIGNLTRDPELKYTPNVPLFAALASPPTGPGSPTTARLRKMSNITKLLPGRNWPSSVQRSFQKEKKSLPKVG